MKKSRPLSPHLSIYKWQITSITSIIHRFTGIVLYIFLIAFCWLFTFLLYRTHITGVDKIQEFYLWIPSALHDCFAGKLLLGLLVFGITFTFIYHCLNGLRYFVWSFAKGMNIKVVETTGYLILTTSFGIALYALYAIWSI